MTDTVTAPAPLRVVCAWCRVMLQDGPPDPVSHGICAPCMALHFGARQIRERDDALCEEGSPCIEKS